MKAVFFLIVILSSFTASSKCPDISEAKLTKDQILVKNLLSSAYTLKGQGISNKNLSGFTDEMKMKFTSISEMLNDSEISDLIIEQDLDNNICPDSTYLGTKDFSALISDKIIETYYGCGCEH